MRRDNNRPDLSDLSSPMHQDAPNLDLLRTLAVSFVVISHLGEVHAGLAASSYHLQALGLLGVAIFFVHTCLVLMLSLDRQSNGPKALVFLTRRILRIYPLSIVVVLVVYFATYSGSDRWLLINNLLLIQNLTGTPSIPAPLWSLPFEMQMYLFLPALFVLCQSRNAFMWLSVTWVASIASVLIAAKLALDYHLIKYLPCFLPGVIAFVLAKRTGRPRKHPALLFGYALIVAAVFPLSVAMGAPETPLLWPICLGLGILVASCRQIGNRLLARVAKIIATYSYGIYLIHSECIDLAFSKMSGYPSAASWVVFLGATGGLAYAAHHLIEQPCIAVGRRLVGGSGQTVPGRVVAARSDLA
jgi:peptidoglycan/LPS O-acetylase OafA/YrhL